MPKEKLTPLQQQNRAVFAENLKRLLAKTNTKQIDLSRATGIPRATVSNYVKQNSTPSPGNVQKIADYFNVSKSDVDPRFKDNSSGDNGYLYYSKNAPVDLDELIENQIPMAFQGREINPEYLKMIKKLLKED